LWLKFDLRNELAQNPIIDDYGGKSSAPGQPLKKVDQQIQILSLRVAERRALD